MIKLHDKHSQPLVCDKVDEFLSGKKLTDEVIEQAGDLCKKVAQPVKNADVTPNGRRRVVKQIAMYALQELRGDDMQEQRRQIARFVL